MTRTCSHVRVDKKTCRHAASISAHLPRVTRNCESSRNHVDTPREYSISYLPYISHMPPISPMSPISLMSLHISHVSPPLSLMSLMSLMSLCVLSHGPCLPYICDFSFTFLSQRVNCEPTNSIPLSHTAFHERERHERHERYGRHERHERHERHGTCI